MKIWTCPNCGAKLKSYRRFQLCYYGHTERIDAALSAPVGDAEEREALAWDRGCDHGQPRPNFCSNCAFGVLARALRSRTAALREAKAKIAALEKKIGCREPYCNDGCVCAPEKKP